MSKKNIIKVRERSGKIRNQTEDQREPQKVRKGLNRRVEEEAWRARDQRARNIKSNNK